MQDRAPGIDVLEEQIGERIEKVVGREILLLRDCFQSPIVICTSVDVQAGWFQWWITRSIHITWGIGGQMDGGSRSAMLMVMLLLLLLMLVQLAVLRLEPVVLSGGGGGIHVRSQHEQGRLGLGAMLRMGGQHGGLHGWKMVSQLLEEKLLGAQDAFQLVWQARSAVASGAGAVSGRAVAVGGSWERASLMRRAAGTTYPGEPRALCHSLRADRASCAPCIHTPGRSVRTNHTQVGRDRI